MCIVKRERKEREKERGNEGVVGIRGFMLLLFCPYIGIYIYTLTLSIICKFIS